MCHVIPPSDRMATIRDRTATVRRPENVRSPANVNTTREKVSKNYKLKQSCVLTAFLLRPVRSYHVLTARPPRPLHAHMAFLFISMGLATAITSDPAALSPRSWGSYHASSTCIASVRRPQGVSTTFSRRLYIKQI